MLYNGIILITKLLILISYSQTHSTILEPNLLPPQVVFCLHWYLVMGIAHVRNSLLWSSSKEILH